MHGLLGRTIGRVLLVAGTLLLVVAWLKLRPFRERLTWWRVLGLWSLPLLVAPPVFSKDAYLYADQAWIIHSGHDPYLVGLGTVAGPFAQQVDPIWVGTTAIYPPLTLAIVHLVGELTGYTLHWTVAAMRIPAIAGVALLAAVLPALARAAGVRPADAIWLGVLNPVVVIHLVGGMHNDALMVGVLALALRVALVPAWRGVVVAGALLGVAATLKQPAVVAGPAIALLASQALRGRISEIAHDPGARPRREDWYAAVLPCLVAALACLATFVAVSLATGFGFGWAGSLSITGAVPSPAPVSLLIQFTDFLLRLGHVWTPVNDTVVIWLGRAAMVAVSGWAMWRFGPANPWRLLVTMLLALAACGAVMHGWYLSWVLGFLALARAGLRIERWLIGLATAMLVYLVLAEYLGWRLVGQVVIGIAVAYVLDRWLLRPADTSAGRGARAERDPEEVEDQEERHPDHPDHHRERDGERGQGADAG